MAYYMNGVNINNKIDIAKYTNAAVSGRFRGMNVLSTLDPLSTMAAGFEACSASPLLGYTWSGTQIYYVVLSSLKRNINNCSSVTNASANGTTFSNTLSYPKVYYVMFQAAGGAGGRDSTGTGTGGGSGYYTISRVVLQPGSSFKVTHYSTYTTCQLVTGTAYMNTAVRRRGYSFSITASAGTAGSPNNSGAGFRRGGQEEKPGGRIEANELSCDGYACPAYAIAGGLPGQDRVSYGSIEHGRGGGGGGAAAGRNLRNIGIVRTGGDGAFYYKDKYNTYSYPAIDGGLGAGGGGGEGPLRGGAGGPAGSFVFY